MFTARLAQKWNKMYANNCKHPLLQLSPVGCKYKSGIPNTSRRKAFEQFKDQLENIEATFIALVRFLQQFELVIENEVCIIISVVGRLESVINSE